MGRRYYGGNSGYIGYSMSVRAFEARREGRFPKTDFKKVYVMSDKVLNILVGMGYVSNDEWHHTSKYGNMTVFYSFCDESCKSCWDEKSDEIKRLARKNNIDEIRKVFDDYEDSSWWES